VWKIPRFTLQTVRAYVNAQGTKEQARKAAI
jgi:hypothetical protein